MAKRKSLKGAKFGELDKALYIWFSSQRSEGKPISSPLIVEKAEKLRRDLGIEEECSFSPGWLRNFKIRHSIHEIQQHGERHSADTEAAEKYTEEFIHLMREHDVAADQVYNADKTALFWRCLPSRTLSSFSEKEKPAGFKKN